MRPPHFYDTNERGSIRLIFKYDNYVNMEEDPLK
jgi:hypothetical protein